MKANALCSSAVVLVLSMSAGGAKATPFSDLYFFGDSLSDSGAYGSLVGPNSKFTTNPDKVWSENLGERYGKPVVSAYQASAYGFTTLASGNNFAVGGARVNARPGVMAGALTPLSLFIPPVSAQVSDYLARGAVNRSALYSVWAGGNDVLLQSEIVRAGGSLGVAQAAMVLAANDMTAQISRLQANGAKYVVVMSVPDVGKAPVGASAGAGGAAVLSSLSTSYNATLSAGLAGSNVLYFDSGKLLDEVFAKPAAYGITNLTTPACGPSPLASLGCAPGSAADGALMADGVHPSGTTHRLISDWVYSTLEGASRVAVLGKLPMERSEALYRSVSGRVQQFQNFGFKGQGLFVTGDYGGGYREAHLGAASTEGNGGAFVLGFDRALSDQLYAGATLGFGQSRFDYGNNFGHVNLDEWSIGGFASQRLGNFYLNALASHAWLDFDSRRNAMIGSYKTTEEGRTRGTQAGARVQVGYQLLAGGIKHGPLAGIAYGRAHVDGFQEKSGSSTAMMFGSQRRESLRSSVGWQIAAESLWGGVRVQPYAQVTYDYEHKEDRRTYRSALANSANGSGLDIETGNRKGGYARIQAGLSSHIGRSAILGLGVMGTIGQAGERNWAVNMTLSSPL